MAQIVLSKILRKEAKTRKMPINQLASECHIPASVLHSWVNGTLPSAKNLHHIRKLSHYLEIPIDELLFGISDKGQRRETLFSTTFSDDGTVYRLIVEKIT